MRTRLLPRLLLIALVACDGGTPSRDPAAQAVQVAATIQPIASIVGWIGGPAVVVETVLPPGAHPDTYEATPRVAMALARADLIVRVGGPADAWVGELEPERTLVLTEGVALRDGGNPHVWLDPLLVRDALVPRIRDALEAAVPEAAEEIRGRARAYADSLTALDGEIRSLLDGVSGRRFVAAHPAWVYFADRYGLEEIGSLVPSPGEELGSRELVRIIEEARAAGVTAVIAEPQLGRAGTGALAGELDITVEVADPVGGAGVEGRQDYLSLMRFNARAFARALAGGGARRTAGPIGGRG